MGQTGKNGPGDRAAGLEALKQAVLNTRHGGYLKALEQFERNLQWLPAAGASETGRQRLLSHYGLCLSMVWGRTTEALTLCQEAVRCCPPSPDLYLNLALVQLRHRRRDLALQTLRRGLGLDPRHMGLLLATERLRTRRKPVFPFLRRAHPLNRFSGRLLTQVQRLLEPV